MSPGGGEEARCCASSVVVQTGRCSDPVHRSADCRGEQTSTWTCGPRGIGTTVVPNACRLAMVAHAPGWMMAPPSAAAHDLGDAQIHVDLDRDRCRGVADHGANRLAGVLEHKQVRSGERRGRQTGDRKLRRLDAGAGAATTGVRSAVSTKLKLGADRRSAGDVSRAPRSAAPAGSVATGAAGGGCEQKERKGADGRRALR